MTTQDDKVAQDERPAQDEQSSQDDKFRLDRDDEDHDFVDQSKIDFDPDDGLYSGTAVEGNSEIAGPHMDTDSGELTGLEEAKQEAADDEAEQPSPEDEGRQQKPSGGRHRKEGR
jgi:hypothetical protein